MSRFIVNSFQMPNAIVDELLEDMSGNALKIYVIITRKTTGWHKDCDSISRSQFMKLAKLSKNTVIKACRELEELGLIISQPENGDSTIYRLDFTSSKFEPVQKMNQQQVQKLNLTSSKVEPVTGSKIEPTKDNNKYTNLNTLKNNKKDSAITEIFEFWKVEFNHPKAKLDQKRTNRIKAVLENYSIDEIKQCLLGAKLDPWLMGNNPSNTVYDGITSILKDSDKIDRLIRLNNNPQAHAIANKEYSATTARNMQAAQEWINDQSGGPF